MNQERGRGRGRGRVRHKRRKCDFSLDGFLTFRFPTISLFLALSRSFALALSLSFSSFSHLSLTFLSPFSLVLFFSLSLSFARALAQMPQWTLDQSKTKEDADADRAAVKKASMASYRPQMRIFISDDVLDEKVGEPRKKNK